ncbi:DUF1365 domain-containing protein [Sinimarinibacterium sp. CAU 1509]|uniref:DUF1365 domain-containing protein n=1 Tax=Sinimarinibacterium sp. CAU 1509 TaxID=2562283 RepID=UPI0010AC7E66|nr:DUF1365 domain-containing protein [Sinimarinibacterium sp. CAU 1509]TJY59816.1 DUF1365 domain-containing protein [Sinimarinibacterium sp. CAU 1509]
MTAISERNAPGCLYPATVMHRRRIAPLYRFVYRVFYLLVDVDRLDELARGLRWLSLDRFNLLSLRTRDYGGSQGLRGWAESVLATQAIDLDGGRIRLLTMPRVLGHAFNPINLWYCDGRGGVLRAVIAEVNNTFGEKHCYVLASDGAALPYGQVIEKDKRFHVSPFLDRRGRYRFVLGEPAEKIRVAIHEYGLDESGEGQAILDATLSGYRQALNDRAVLGQVLRMPWMTLKVVAAIHWQALKIWIRGARLFRKPEPLSPDVS